MTSDDAPHPDLDATGLKCPLPVLKIRKRLAPLRAGQTLRVWTDDPAALLDVPHFCAEHGHSVVVSDDSRFPRQTWLIRKGA